MDIINLISILSIISVSTERIVEVIKPMLPEIPGKYKTSIYSILAFVTSSGLFVLNGSLVEGINPNIWIQSGLVGLACSAGSGFWNNIITALKEVKKPG